MKKICIESIPSNEINILISQLKNNLSEKGHNIKLNEIRDIFSRSVGARNWQSIKNISSNTKIENKKLVEGQIFTGIISVPVTQTKDFTTENFNFMIDGSEYYYGPFHKEYSSHQVFKKSFYSNSYSGLLLEIDDFFGFSKNPIDYENKINYKKIIPELHSYYKTREKWIDSEIFSILFSGSGGLSISEINMYDDSFNKKEIFSDVINENKIREFLNYDYQDFNDKIETSLYLMFQSLAQSLTRCMITQDCINHHWNSIVLEVVWPDIDVMMHDVKIHDIGVFDKYNTHITGNIIDLI